MFLIPVCRCGHEWMGIHFPLCDLFSPGQLLGRHLVINPQKSILRVHYPPSFLPDIHAHLFIHLTLESCRAPMLTSFTSFSNQIVAPNPICIALHPTQNPPWLFICYLLFVILFFWSSWVTEALSGSLTGFEPRGRETRLPMRCRFCPFWDGEREGGRRELVCVYLWVYLSSVQHKSLWSFIGLVVDRK